jgi:peptide/nickel transport system substrate-binding protein
MAQTDPAFISSDSEVLFANHVYDYLVDINPQNQIVPRLATEWSVSDDGLAYTFTLADGTRILDPPHPISTPISRRSRRSGTAR